ncbi:MAG: Crp/Fnr family transcriptional regulator [Pseudomonadota bacterium]
MIQVKQEIFLSIFPQAIMITASASPLVHLIDKISLHIELSSEDRVSLLNLPYSTRVLEAGSYLLREGDLSDQCGIITSGFACRHKVSSDGSRQIVGIIMPGEIFDLQRIYVDIADSNVQALRRCEIIRIPHAALRRLTVECPSIERAFIVLMMVDLSISREWMLNIGRRDARTRMAHFLCEFAFRLDKRGLAPGQDYELPMTQEQLGDALGLTAVHINRMFNNLVKDGLIKRSKRGVSIPNWERIVNEAGFSSRYLYSNQTGLPK